MPKNSRHPTIEKVEAWKRWPAPNVFSPRWMGQKRRETLHLGAKPHFWVVLLNRSMACAAFFGWLSKFWPPSRTGWWVRFHTRPARFYWRFSDPSQGLHPKRWNEGGDVHCTRGWFCDDHVFFKSNKKTWVEKKKHAAFGEDFLVTANWVEAFFLPPYTSQMEFNWSAYTSPVSKLQHGGVRCCVAMHLFLEEAGIMSSESGCRW